MGMIGDFINNKVVKIKKDRFLDNIHNLIKEGERQRTDLYRINNHLKNELLNCTRLGEIFNINIELPSIPSKFTERIYENSADYINDFRNIRNIYISCKEDINKYNNIVDDISKYYGRISQYNDVVEDIKCYIKDNEIPDYTESLIKFGLNRNKELFCMVSNFGKQKITRIRNLEVDIFYGKFHKEKDYYAGKGFMHLGVDVIDFHPSIEIKAIDIRIKEKRVGIGTFALKWLENTIIPELNRRIDKFNNKPKSEEEDIQLYHIKEIYGVSGGLSSDTNREARKKFYTKNGYSMDRSTFRKRLSH